MINFPPDRFDNLTPDEITSHPTLDEAFEDILREEYNVIRKYEENPNDDRETNIKLCGDEGPNLFICCPSYSHYEGLRLLPSVCEQIIIQQTLICFVHHKFTKILPYRQASIPFYFR